MKLRGSNSTARLKLVSASCNRRSSTVNGSYGYVDASFVRQKFFRLFKLFQSAIVITKAVIGIETFLRVDFARVRLDFFGFLQSDSGQFAPLFSVISPTPI